MTREKEKKQLVIGTVYSEWKYSLQELVKEHVSLAKSLVAYETTKAFGGDYQPENVESVIRQFGRTKDQIEISKKRCERCAEVCYHWKATFNFVVNKLDPNKQIMKEQNFILKIPNLLVQTLPEEKIPESEIKEQLIKHLKGMCDSMVCQLEQTINHLKNLEKKAEQKQQEKLTNSVKESEEILAIVEKYQEIAKEQDKTKVLFQETYEYILEKMLKRDKGGKNSRNK
jgi:hypothetical protein